MANKLISAIIKVSEKAANVARSCWQDEHLLSFLIQEKKEGEKNPRFLTDFKTVADVLVQELVKHDLCSEVIIVIAHYIFIILIIPHFVRNKITYLPEICLKHGPRLLNCSKIDSLLFFLFEKL